MAESIPLRITGWPASVPQLAVVHCSQRRHGLGVVRVLATASAFEAAGGRFALCCGRARANLPMPGSEFRVADHAEAFGHVLHQTRNGFALLGTAYRLRGPLPGTARQLRNLHA